MSFAHPTLLLLLVIPVTLAFWEWTRSGQTLVMPFDNGPQRRGRFLRLLVLSANTLPAMLLAVAILFMARPITFAPPETERKLTNIQLVLDTSPSMSEPYGQPTGTEPHTRFDAAMDAMNQFLAFREGDAFGLTVFAKNFIHWIPLTTDTSAIRLSRPFTRPFTLTAARGRPASLPDRVWTGTFIGNALSGAADLLAQRPVGDRMIILLTDGQSPDIQNGREQPVLDRLRKENITLFAVQLSNDENEPGLVRLTSETGGQVFNAVDSVALQSVFRQIDQMKRVEILQKDPQVIDLFRPFFWPAAVVMTLQMLCLFGLRFNPW